VGKTWRTIQSWLIERRHPHGRGEDTSVEEYETAKQETPPRAWGRLPNAPNHLTTFRNTPTGVGKTHTHIHHHTVIRKHPHGRGEDYAYLHPKTQDKETPPRAWGRLGLGSPGGLNDGNTPTGVGKTSETGNDNTSSRKHPHGRGEDRSECYMRMRKVETPPRAWGRPMRRRSSAGRAETPPRAWGRPEIQNRDELRRRNTPTGVGKTNNIFMNKLLS